MSHPSAGAASAISPMWRAWVAENVLRGVEASQIVAQMATDGGFSAQQAQAELARALEHPYLAAAAKLGVGTVSPGARGTSARADKYAWWLEVQRRTSKLASTHGTLPRVKNPSRESFLDDFYAPNLPCLIEGAIDDWPALTKWTPDYLKATCGDQIVEVQANRADTDTVPLNTDDTMRFGDYVDIVERGESDEWYMTANNDPKNRDALAALWDDVAPLPDFLTTTDGPIGNAFLWYGPGGTLSKTHHDLTNNLMAQVIGRKRVRIVSPNESAHMYNDYNRNSLVNLERPDFDAHPELEGVTILDVEIGPGDLLFLPAGWWHNVRALEASFTFTFTNFVYDANDYYSFYTSERQLDED